MIGIPKIAITMGDPGGIGPEVIIKSLSGLAKDNATAYIIIGVEKPFIDIASFLKISPEFERIKNIDEAKSHGIYFFWPSGLKATGYIPGKIDKKNGYLAIEALKTALALALENKISAVVTAPVSKQAINESGISFTGHTEFFAGGSRVKRPVMMFVTERLKVALLTTHLPYKKVLLYLNKSGIISTLLICNDNLKKYFAMENPRIAVCGLNPHAGENGLFGKEEDKTIMPAIEAAKKEGINCSGPFPADTIFYQALKNEFDMVLALYHDQGLIPVKTVSDYKGANITLGMPFIRTSVMHGTAFDIAGKGIAIADSMDFAIKTARQMMANGG
jgi:4-hydroxythreonine-4-phosphate dehydrogenase